MANMSSSNALNNSQKKRAIPFLEIWMAASSVALAVGYLLIRTRAQNYAHVYRWLRESLSYLLGH
jgi:hypothetical protein